MKRWLYENYGIGIFFILIAVVLLLAGVMPRAMNISARKASDEYEIKVAKVIEVAEKDSRHIVTVEFANGDSMKQMPLNMYSEGMKVGDELEVWYAKSDWRKVTLVGSDEKLVRDFGITSGILFVVGVVAMFLRKRRENEN